MDPLFLRQAWAGNEPLLLELSQDASPLGRARLHAFLSTRGRGRAWTTTRRSSPACRRKPARQLLSRRRHQGGGRELGEVAPGRRAARRPRASTPPSAGRPTASFGGVPYSVEYQGELGAAAQLLREAAALTDAAHAEDASSTRARTRSSPTTTTRATWPGWSWTRASSRPSGPTRSTRTTGSTTRPRSRRSSRVRDEAETQKLAQLLRASCRSIENDLPIDAKLRNPKLGRAGAHPRGQQHLLLRRRQPRRADRRLQPAQRRAHRARRRAPSA